MANFKFNKRRIVKYNDGMSDWSKTGMVRNAIEHEECLIEGPAGQLQAVLEYAPDAGPCAVAVVCHPHPQYGGTLDNKVAFTLARAAVDTGAAALRFNFRGVGRSTGNFAAGTGEAEDLAAAETWLAARWPQLPVWRLGFSFGAAMVLKRTAAAPCAALIAVAPPTMHFFEYGYNAGPPRAAHWLLIQGDADEVVDSQAVLAWAGAQEPLPEIRVVEGAGHFFHGRLTVLRTIVVDFLNNLEEAC
jgi:alpha/beta superfamily hydrolase